MDFTLKTYSQLMEALRGAGYGFAPVKELYGAGAEGKLVFLRHDVDLMPENSLRTALSEAAVGIRATYYFRAVPQSWDEDIIREIVSLGHEVGYHYESLAACHGDIDAGWEDFKMNLEHLRAIAPVETVCMHGSPRSPFDSRDIWKKYDYKSLGIKGEPYMDTDWSSVFYLTDTGRCWDGCKVSVRDRIPHWQDVWSSRGLVFHSTSDIIDGAGRLPYKIMITTHPQRWNDSVLPWIKEFVSQNIKNIVKSCINASRTCKNENQGL